MENNVYGGGASTQNSQAYNNNSYKDPLEHYSERVSKGNSNPQSQGSFLDTFILHGQVQACESELQFLNSNKSDQGGTSVGISDSKLRFLVIKSHGIFQVAFWSIILNFILFSIFFLYVNQIGAFLLSTALLFHAFFPAYIIYGMKRFVGGEKFTKKFYLKMMNLWRFFEITYLCILFGVIYLTTLDWNVAFVKIVTWLASIKFIGPILAKLFMKIEPLSLHLLFQVYGLILLVGIIGYLIMIYRRRNTASKEQEDIKFEHDKETLRAIQIARIKAGKARRK